MPSNSKKSRLCKIHNWNIFMVRGASAALGNVIRAQTSTPETVSLAIEISNKLKELIELLKKRNYPDG